MEHLVFIFSGFGVVMLVLSALWLVTAAVGKLFIAYEARQAAAVAPVAQAPAAPAGVPRHHIIAIAAAVAAMTGGQGRVVRISAPAHQAAAWAHEGRAAQFAGRKARRDWARPGPVTPDSKGKS
jgi:Na+-transporting methylmalonyl-CoA/oxaloacetate decarboxylase gamma subunit